MDSETKLIPSFRVGERTAETAWYFMQDFSERVSNRLHLTTDGFRPYANSVDDAFGANIDYAMLVKLYCESGQPNTRSSPGEIVDARPIPIMGNPKLHLISTSHIERRNLTILIQLRRFTRLTDAISKKLENLNVALPLHFAWYNFCRIHSTLRVTPATAAGVSSEILPLTQLLA